LIERSASICLCRMSKTGKPLRAVVNTHCHLDHTSGNTGFADVPILAHEKTLPAMNACLGPRHGENWSIRDFATKLRFLFGQNILELVPHADLARRWFEDRISLPDYDTVVICPPSETFADSFAFHLPDDTVRLHYFGPAHCDGDIVVHLERRKVAFLGDLLFHGRFPWLGDCDLNGLIAALGRVLALDVAVVISGHGPPTTSSCAPPSTPPSRQARPKPRQCRRSLCRICPCPTLQGVDAARRAGGVSVSAWGVKNSDVFGTDNGRRMPANASWAAVWHHAHASPCGPPFRAAPSFARQPAAAGAPT
jgi:glyoxylase-like metal-dependent hydrolase (beta-lactamase superfamily II)